jgi:DNA-binding CsgD family transcriptional regulator
MAVSSIHYGGQTATLAMAYDITESKQAKDALLLREQELRDKAHDLEEMNTALRVLLKKRDDDKVEVEEKIQFNVKELIEPYLNNLKETSLTDRQKTLLGIITTNLAEIISPFARNFASIKYKLTPQEIKIASLIRQGKKTKEIAEIMNLSIRTIEFHRTKIREKIGLQSHKDSLQAHLLSINLH